MKPNYGTGVLAEYESRAYDHGYARGYAGDNIDSRSQLARCYPNAYHRGYWNGVGVREKEQTT